MGEEEEISNRGLVLSLGRGEFVSEGRRDGLGLRKRSFELRPIEFHILFPPHNMKEEMEIKEEADVDGLSCKTTDEEGEDANTCRNNKTSTRKKLKLTQQQSTLLDESFKQHSTLTPIQKQELAKKLNLRPRQVEVWFQNRRARTKLKQTEVDCEFLRKCCESLSEENQRLKKEVQELRSIKLGLPLYVQLPKATRPLTMCPSCDRTATTNSPDTWLDVAKTNKSHTPIRDSSMYGMSK